MSGGVACRESTCQPHVFSPSALIPLFIPPPYPFKSLPSASFLCRFYRQLKGSLHSKCELIMITMRPMCSTEKLNMISMYYLCQHYIASLGKKAELSYDLCLWCQHLCLAYITKIFLHMAQWPKHCFIKRKSADFLFVAISRYFHVLQLTPTTLLECVHSHTSFSALCKND